MIDKKILVRDIMTKSVITIEKNAKFSLVEEKFTENRIRHLPVVDSGGGLVGLISKRDLFRIALPRKTADGSTQHSDEKIFEKDGAFYIKDILDHFILKNVMVTDVKILREDNSIAEAVHIMVSKKIGSVVIVDDQKKVCGIITRFDILKLVDQMLKNG